VISPVDKIIVAFRLPRMASLHLCWLVRVEHQDFDIAVGVDFRAVAGRRRSFSVIE